MRSLPLKKVNKLQAQTHQAKELSDHLATQMMLSKISTRLLQANNENYHHLFASVVRLLGNFSRADRCFVLQKGKDRQYYLVSQWLHQWEAHAPAPGMISPVPLPGEIDRALLSHELAWVYPGKSEREKDQAPGGMGFHHPQAASAMIVPIIEGKAVVACLGMESAAADKHWQKGDIELLRTSAEYFATTMARIRAEREKQESEEKYRLLVNKAPLGIFTVDTAGYLTQYNPKMEAIIVQLGFDLSGPINVLTHENLINIGFSKDVETCLNGEDIPPRTRSYATPEGRILYFRSHMTALRKEDLEITGVQIIVEEITPLFQAEQRLRESERFLTDVMSSLKTGVVIIDPETCQIVNVNPYAAHLIGLDQKEIIGNVCHLFICPQAEGECPLIDLGQELDNSERFLLTHDGTLIPILKSVSRIQHRGKALFLECFTDIRELKRLLDEQQLDIKTSKNILSAINGHFPRYTPLKENLTLFSTAFSLPCQAEGGDHFFIRTLTMDPDEQLQKTIVSLKDQSGHQVGCILRSIITDLLHQAILCDTKFADVGRSMNRLNELLEQGRFIEPDNFCTALVLCLDHHSLSLKYALCGHPRFLLIRGSEAVDVPEASDRRGMNMPLGVSVGLSFGSGDILLQKSDKLIVFTDGLTEINIGKKGSESAANTLQPLELLAMAQAEKGLKLSEPVERIVAKMVAVASEISGTAINGEGIRQNPDDITVIGLEIEGEGKGITEKWHPKDLKELQAKMDRFLALRLNEWRSRGFSRFVRLQTCVEEAIINAWKHGNRRDPDKAIGVRYRWGNDFHLTVEDEGAGFDVSKIPNPCDGKRLTQESGRGIFMIRRTACEMRYNSQGNEVYLRLSPDNASLAGAGWQTQKQKLPRLWETLRNGRSC